MNVFAPALVAAGLFVKSLYNVSRVDLGLKTEQLVTFSISPELNGYSPAQSIAFFERVEDALAAVPGVTSVSSSTVGLIGGSNWNSSLRVQGFEAGPDTNTTASFSFVGPDFFRTLGIPLIRGREFTRADAAGTPKVAVVNEAFVRKFNLGDHAIGTHITDGKREDPLDIDDAIDTIQRRTGRRDFGVIRAAWIPTVLYNHLKLQDYLAQTLPSKTVACPEDRGLLTWQRNPSRFWEEGEPVPFSGNNPAPIDQRWAYSSSYRCLSSWWSRDHAARQKAYFFNDALTMVYFGPISGKAEGARPVRQILERRGD